MIERGENSPCEGCPFQYLPSLSEKALYVLHVWNAISAPAVQEYGLVNFALAAYKPEITTFEAQLLLNGINYIHDLIEKHKQKRIDGNQAGIGS